MTFGREPAPVAFAAGPRSDLRSTPPARPQHGRLAAATGSALVRVLGVYIATAAGTVQLLDILVDRFGWSERIFLTAIIVGVIGVPITAAAAMIRDAVREERRPAPRRESTGTAPDPVPTVAAARPRRADPTSANRDELTRRPLAGRALAGRAQVGRAQTGPAAAAGDAAAADGALAAEPVALASRVELALSHRRVAVAHVRGADAVTATAHFEAFAAEAERARDQLTALIEEARRHVAATRNQTQAE
jgi:hypothetical protein